MVSPAEDDSEDEHEVPAKALPPEVWRPCPAPVVFKDLRLEWRCQEAAAAKNTEEARHGVGERSFVRLRVEPEVAAFAGAVEFFLGEESGHQWSEEESTDLTPPEETQRVGIPRWLTEAALCLRRPGAAARFRAADGAQPLDDGRADVEYHVQLQEVQRGASLLGDAGILMRQLRIGNGGARATDASTVRASWRAWFQRNRELIFSTGGDLENAAEAVQVVIDEDDLMAALQLGLKHLEAGGRGLLRISEEWGIGQLLPSGGPTLRSAAVWIDLCVHEVVNPPLPGHFQDAESCLEFAQLRKSQGNGHLASGDAAGLARASRRYEEGIAALAALDKALVGGLMLLAALRRNAALAYLRRERWADAASVCTAVLNEGPDAKAFFRRGTARLRLEDFDGAVEDLREALAWASDSESLAVRQELAKAQARRKEWQQEQRKAFQGVFEKMTHQDEEREKRQQEEARHRSEQPQEASAPPDEAPKETKPDEDSVEKQVSAMVQPAEVENETESTEQEGYPTAQEKDFRSVTLPKRQQETGITALMPPPGARVSQPPPKVENYEVPSFLRKKQQKRS